MARYRLTSPEGASYIVTAPDDASMEEVRRFAFTNFQAAAPPEQRQSAEDLMIPRVSGTPEYAAQQTELTRRNAEANAAEAAWQRSRGYAERAGGVASFVASAPVRALTRGEYGAGDIVGALSPSLGGKITSSEADFVRANPEVVRTIGGIGEIAAGIPALNTMGGIARPPAGVTRRVVDAETRARDASRDAAAFDAMRVRQFGPALNEGPSAGVAKGLSDTLFVGGPLKSALEASVTDAGAAARRVGAAYSDVATPEAAGRVVQQGLERFRDARPTEVVERAVGGYTPSQRQAIIAAPARDTSLKTKQAALYERAWSYIPDNMRDGRAVEGLPRVMGDLPEARALLTEIQGRNARMTVGGGGAAAAPIASSGLAGQMVNAIMTRQWRASLQTMRDMRSDFRRLASGIADTEKNTLRASDIERLQGAITRDMVSLIERNAVAYQRAGRPADAANMMRAAREFRRADQFTALSVQRLETIERMFNAPDATSLYRSIAQAAKGRDRGNIEAIRTLNRVLRREDLDGLAAGVIQQLGEPVGSARGVAERVGFSVQSFTTNWNNMNPAAKTILFAGPHRAALEDLARVSRRLANVEAWANTSRTANTATNVGTVLAGGGAYVGGGLETLLGSLAAGGATSVLMSSEAYARWMTGYLRARAAAYRAGSTARDRAQLAVSVNQLGYLAQRDPGLAPIHEAVANDNRSTRNDRR